MTAIKTAPVLLSNNHSQFCQSVSVKHTLFPDYCNLTSSHFCASRLTCLSSSPLLSLQCNNDYAPVCGSNNKNYQNECFLRRDACKQQSEILIVSEGDCPAGMYVHIMALTQNIHKQTHTCRGAWYHRSLQYIPNRSTSKLMWAENTKVNTDVKQ